MTPNQAKRLIEAVFSITDELHAIRGFLEDTADRMIVALSSVN